MSVLIDSRTRSLRPTVGEAVLLAAARILADLAAAHMRRRSGRLESEPARRAGFAASQAMTADIARYLPPR